MKNVWTIVGIVLIVVLLLLLVGGAAFAVSRVGTVGMMGQPGNFGMMGRYGGFGLMGGFRPIGWLISCVIGLLVIGGAVVFIFWLVGRSSKTPITSPTTLAPAGESPLDILKMRYAKGEITKEQYDAMKQDLA